MPGRVQAVSIAAHENTELPAIGFVGRWTAARKGGVVDAVSRGLMTPEAALARYPGLTADELESWLAAYKAVGRNGLAARKGLVAMRPGTRLRTGREEAAPRDIIPSDRHQRVRLPRLSFLDGGRHG